MKRLITLIMVAVLTTAAMATDYTDRLVININGVQTSSQQATITVEQQTDGRYSLSLKNFVLNQGGQTMGIGNIILNDVYATTLNGVTTLWSNQNVNITDGDDPSVAVWTGKYLGPVPVNMMAQIRGSKLYTVIDITLATQTVKVIFGNGGFQINNSDFEAFHTATISSPDGANQATSDEPNAWHSFMSASGDAALAFLAGYNPHTFISSLVRPGSLGTKSVLLTSLDMTFVVANGTMTTGRINTGAMLATDKSNHAWLDMDSIGVDGNGDPFYATMNGHPDSLSVWVKFKQGTPTAAHPYATINAVITDGTYYQDPEDKTYSNVVAKATDNTIESKNFAWQKITIPFDYESYKANNASTKAILVTVSTNADAGQGSTDSLYVDDLTLIYNCKLNSLRIHGKEVEGFDKNIYSYNVDYPGNMDINDFDADTDGKGSVYTKSLEASADGMKASIIVTSGDFASTSVYTVNVKGATSGISNVDDTSAKVEGIYNLNGQRVNAMNKKGVYILKMSSGKTFKRLQK
jgi:hypothetical protein